MRGSAARVLLPVLAVLALVGVVAVAATGSTPSGTADGRPPADAVLDTFFTIVLLLYLPAIALLVYGLLQRKEIAREIASGRHRRMNLLAFLALVTLVTAAVSFRLANGQFRLGGGDNEVVDAGRTTRRPAPGLDPTGDTGYDPEFAWIPAIVVVALAVIGIAAYVLASRRRKMRLAAEEGVAEAVAESLEETLDDLRAEPDPRRAVIAAFARLERALASSGLPRVPAETAEEYVGRVLARLEVERTAVRELTDLFAEAKFSQHRIDAGMKEHAISALERVRDDLREAARRGLEEQEERAPDRQAVVT